jgi:hypothetical protein
MQTEDIGRYQRARTIAQCFSQTAMLINETCLKESPRREPLLVVPFVVNASFACELYLKALAHRGGVRLEGHQLAKLLVSLPTNERHSLARAWAAVARGGECKIAETLESVIRELSNSFVEWRYTHEKERVSAASSASILHLLRVLDDASQYSSGA